MQEVYKKDSGKTIPANPEKEIFEMFPSAPNMGRATSFFLKN